MYRHTPYIYNIGSSVKLLFCCLLGLLSVTAAGQTSAPFVAKKPGVEWYQMLMNGGMTRQYTDLLDKHRGWYMIMPNGLTDIITMNYVDGYSVGLHSTIGRMQLNRSRWELEESAYYAFDRKALVAKGALRYMLPVEYETVAEIYGGQFMEDFDPDPVMPRAQSLMASGICGWNHYKLYESTSAGVKLSLPLTFDLKMSAQLGWERRRPKENSKSRNLFGAHAQSNDPRVGIKYSAYNLLSSLWNIKTLSDSLILYDGPIAAELFKASFRFDYKRMRSLLVMDDMTVKESLSYPTISLLLDMGIGKNRDEDNFRFLTVDARVGQTIACSRLTDQFIYAASVGFVLQNGNIGLADMHHFDASRFWWQRQQSVTRFALLDNYELSTDEQWIEGHAEWNSTRMLLNRIVPPNENWREFVQIHGVAVADHRLHWESQYGWELLNFLRVGVSVGFDDFTYRGTAVSMTLDLNAARQR